MLIAEQRTLLQDLLGKQLGKEPLVIALEGQSYAGKTSALRGLCQDGCGTIREYSEYKSFSAPDVLERHSRTSAEQDLLFYLGIEQQRMQAYRELKQKHSVLFLDRSIYTLIAYRFALQSLSHAFSDDFLHWVITSIGSEAQPVLYPHYLFYIDIPLSEARQRQGMANDHLPPYFLDERFYTSFRAFFQELASLKPEKVKVIDGTSTKEATLRRIREASMLVK